MANRALHAKKSNDRSTMNNRPLGIPPVPPLPDVFALFMVPLKLQRDRRVLRGRRTGLGQFFSRGLERVIQSDFSKIHSDPSHQLTQSRIPFGAGPRGIMSPERHG